MTSVQLDLRDIATGVIERAMKLGATAAECVARDGSEFSTVVRLGEVETLKESGSKALGVRVFMGNRTANTSTSDLSPEGVESMIKGAIELAKVTGEDPFSGIPEKSQLGQISGNLAFDGRSHRLRATRREGGDLG
jgi:PmbA protein